MVCATPVRDMTSLSIAKDYSAYPVGRFPEDSMYNGERFREEFLAPALRKGDQVTVDIDGTEGYGSSFLEEAFDGLVRKGYFSAKELLARLVIQTRDPDYGVFKTLIWKHIQTAKKE